MRKRKKSRVSGIIIFLRKTERKEKQRGLRSSILLRIVRKDKSANKGPLHIKLVPGFYRDRGGEESYFLFVQSKQGGKKRLYL